MKEMIHYREETLKKRTDEIYAAKNNYLDGEKAAGNGIPSNRYFERIGLNTYKDNRPHKPKYCHVFINNIQFPQSLKEVRDIFTRNGQYDIEYLISSNEISWTSPNWAKAGDVCLFMHAKTANSNISRLKTELINSKDLYSESDYQQLLSWLERENNYIKNMEERYSL